MLDDELQEEMEKEVPADIPYVFISSVAQKNITELKDLLWKEINQVDFLHVISLQRHHFLPKNKGRRLLQYR
jgi:hypothetical protein